ncbi:MAG TPA: multiheme c-type cytochrome, partial [Planctomycetota bacterium]|nr:multiheme c-type cytochrome [Planctomycetota bacterium]
LDTWRLFKNERSLGVVSICANLRDDEGRELAAGTAEFLLGRRRVVVTAILSPSFEAGLREAGVPVRLAPPAESVRAALARAGKGDIVVLLSHAPPEESAALLRELKEVDVAATAHAGDEAGAEPELIDGRPLFRPGTAWRSFVGAGFPAAAPGGSRPVASSIRRVVEPKHLAEGLPPPPQMPVDAALMELRLPGRLETSYRDALARRTAVGGAAMAGPASCLSCHAAPHASWQTSPHARSVASLRKTGNEATPHCLSCHATGLGAPGGFPDGGPAQASVSCEACHGPGAAHAAAAEPARVRLADAKSSCAACHTAEVSPKFDPVEGWKKAGHSK